jgi:subtilisin family serine protease
MMKASWTNLISLFAVLVLCPIGNPAEDSFDYVVTVGDGKLTFVARPERGYVLKAAPNRGKMGILAATLFIEDGDVTPIRGLGRQGIWIVERPLLAGKSELAMQSLRGTPSAQYMAPLLSSNGETVAIIPEIVVRVIAGTAIEHIRELCESLDVAIIKRMEFTEQEYLLEVLGPNADSVFSAVEQLNGAPFVEWACPNTASRLKLCGQVIPNDEYFSEQWHLNNTGQICLYGTGGTPNADINAPEAWEITTGDPNIVLAVLDTGVDSNHPDLINNMVPGYDFWEDDDLPDPALVHWRNAHGTACAGLIAAQGNNSIGVSGVAWNCNIMPIRVYSASAQGQWDFTTRADRATAIRWAAASGAHILSNSWAGTQAMPPIESAIADVTKPGGLGRDGKGCVVFCASGNDNDSVRWPARYPEVIAVGATNHHDVRWHYSNYGPELDIVAPGGGLELTDIPGGFLCTTDISGPDGVNNRGMPDVYGPMVNLHVDYRYTGGTSDACPITAGVAALILSVEPNLTNDEVRHFLEQSAKDLGAPGWDQYYGWGRVDARAALDMVLAKRADLNGDWKVDWRDFAVLAQFWRTSGPEGDVGPAPRPDGFVDIQDVILMSQYWMDQIPSTGLRAHWRLDETEGDVAYDCIGNHNAVVHEGEWTEGIIDGALQFDGFNTYMDCGQSEVLGPEQMTLTMWLRPEHMGGMRYIVSRGTNSPDDMDYVLMRHRNGELEFAVGQLGSDPVSVLSTGQTPLDEWSHVAVSMDGSRASVYINGELDAFADYAERVAREGHRLVISSYQASTRFYNGKIDDVRIYDAALSAEEIKAIER